MGSKTTEKAMHIKKNQIQFLKTLIFGKRA